MFKRVFSFTVNMVILAAVLLIGCGSSPKVEQKQYNIEPAASAQTEVVSVRQVNPVTAVNTTAQNQLVKTIDASSYFYDVTKSPKYEMRGVWVASVMNIDMPAGMNKEAFTKWAAEVCQNVKVRNQNTIVFQVKPTADALYKSTLAPWSLHINGKTQGVDPGYDPLQIMIDAAHSRGIELHAWINPYRVTMASQKFDTLSKDNAAVKNPSWVIAYNNQFYLNPGLPEVRKYLVDCVAEIVTNYDVDAIHMDDYFYPYPASGIAFPDGDAYKKYGAGFKTAADWRRNNVNVLVAEINRTIKSIKPYVQFGISPFGVWRNIASDPSGSNTKAGVENYDSLNADTRQWLKDGSIDYLAPQIYWSRISTAANYTVLIDWWNNEVLKYTKNAEGDSGAHPVNLYVGLADYKVGTNNDGSWEKTNTEISGQITDNYAKDAITGQIHYNYSSLIKNPLGYFELVKSNNYKSIALTPPSPWNGLEAAAPPEVVEAVTESTGLLVKIKSAQNSQNTRKYVIYRFDTNTPITPERYTNDNIIAVVYNNGNPQYLDTTAVKATGYIYAVRAVSNTGIEGEVSVSTGTVFF